MGQSERPAEQDLSPATVELQEAVRDFAFALETICARIPSDQAYLGGYELAAYEALVKHPEHVRSRHVRQLMGLEGTP